MLTTGFVKIRRGIHEHITEGRLTWNQAHVYIDLILLANPSTGIWHGCSGHHASLFGLNPRTCRDAIENLEKLGYIKRFVTPGSHSNYPILINKYLCTDGAAKDKRLNSVKTIDWKNPVYDFCEEGVKHGVKEDVKDGAGDTKKELRSKNKNKHIAYSAEFLSLWEAYPRKDSKFKAFEAFKKSRLNGELPMILKSIQSHRRCVDWTKDDGKFIPYLATFINQRRWEDEIDEPTTRV